MKVDSINQVSQWVHTDSKIVDWSVKLTTRIN